MAARGRNTSTATAAATRAPGDTGMGPPTVESIIADTYNAVVNRMGSPGSVWDMSWGSAGREEQAEEWARGV